jgi:hypothetical protein
MYIYIVTLFKILIKIAPCLNDVTSYTQLDV